ncbi:MAG: hypothetical protein ABI565_08535, partial [Vicinamibacteria bacterium]
ILNIVRKHGFAVAPALGIAASVAYLLLVSWWGYAAWRPQEKRAPAGARVRPGLVLEPTA